MKRKEFIEKSLIGLGAFSLTGTHVSCTNTQKNGTDNQIPDGEEQNVNIQKGFMGLDAKVVLNNGGQRLNVIGDNQIIKLKGVDTGGKFTLIEQNNDPGVGIPPHVHADEDEVFQVLSGQVEININGKSSILRAGDLAFCPKGVPHSWKVIGDEKAKTMLSIFPAGLEFMFEELAGLPAGPPDLKKVAEICSKYNLKFV